MLYKLVIPAFLLTAIFLTSGCSTLGIEKALENRVACTVAKDEAHTISRWGFFGFAFKVSEKDLKYLCPAPLATP